MLKKILLVFTAFFLFVPVFNTTTFTYAADEWENKANCEWKDSLCSPSFEIKVSDIAPGWKNIDWVSSWQTAAKTWAALLQSIINKLMIAFWVLALLIMTIWAWYMIFYHGQDELLSKWKTIFTAGIIALVVALSAWILVKIVAYMLY